MLAVAVALGAYGCCSNNCDCKLGETCELGFCRQVAPVPTTRGCPAGHSCTAKTDCAAFCDPVTHVCADTLSNGVVCAAAKECTSGFCDPFLIPAKCGPAPAHSPNNATAPVGLCGDSVLNPGEDCDPPGFRGGPGYVCGGGCKWSPHACGNNSVELPAEDCDPPGSLGVSAACTKKFVCSACCQWECI
jgi:hypothetical protein